jgi:GntR family transcriptional regulator
MVPANPAGHVIGLVGMFVGGDAVADPLWKQIAEDLRQKIESGRLGADGKPLPTELELQDTYNASRNTVRDAIKWLVTRNLVYTRSGQGTFVTRKTAPFVTVLTGTPESGMEESTAFATQVHDQSREAEVSIPRVEIQKAAGFAADELHIPGDATVISRHQTRSIDGAPYSRQTTFYPLRYVELGAARLLEAANINEGAVAYLRKALRIEQAGWRDRIGVRAPDTEESAFFGIPDDGSTPVFEIIRTGYDSSGQPLRVTVTTYPADRNQFVMTSGAVPGSPPDPDR